MIIMIIHWRFCLYSKMILSLCSPFFVIVALFKLDTRHSLADACLNTINADSLALSETDAMSNA